MYTIVAGLIRNQTEESWLTSWHLKSYMSLTACVQFPGFQIHYSFITNMATPPLEIMRDQQG
jgi:hypothetical protein